MGTRLRLILATVVGYVCAVMGAAGPVSAECTGFDSWPSFADAAPVAERVFIATVVESYADDSTDHALLFRLRVDDVLHGQVPSSIEYHDVVRSGAPLVVCSDSMLRVRVGDVWAFADGAHVNPYQQKVLAVAIVNRDLNDVEQFLMPGVERLSRSAIQRLVDLPPTDALPAQLTAPSWSNPWLVPALAFGGGPVALWWALRRRQPRDIPRR
ncbi:MAG TPA: hypothetical protein VFI15_12345 [Candidatus Limnocylindrales bacterium]|nr:hypothetical protein [Candidatus Limnocylindrales bacterium]